MAALVQAYPQQSSTVTMLQTRPSSASGILQTGPQTQSHHPYPASQQMQRNSFHGMNNGMGMSSYRGQTTTGPIAPYAFTSTPNLALPSQRAQGPHLRQDLRTSSAPHVPTFESGTGSRSRYPAQHSVSTTSSSSSDLSSASNKSGSRDDSAIMSTARVVSSTARTRPTVVTSSPASLSPTIASPVKSTPDRYRRPNNRRTESDQTTSTPPASASTASIPNVVQFYGNNTQSQQPAPIHSRQTNYFELPQSARAFTAGFTLGASTDDMILSRNIPTQDPAKRYRRRSIHTIDAGDFGGSLSDGLLQQQGSRQVSSANGRIDQHPLRSSPVMGIRPVSSHGRNGSSESVNSTRSASGHHSRPSSAAKREASLSIPPNPAAIPSPVSPAVNTSSEQTSIRQDVPRLVNIPPRASSTDAAKRITAPSPLSKPMTMSAVASASKDSFASAVNAALQPPVKPTYAQVANGTNAGSPAAQQLAALNSKEGKKSKSSRLRRAFSFGSAAELRRASAENSAANNVADRSKARTDKYEEEQDAEQARIAQQQEAGGIGSGIYSGQGNIFSGSTDNISISSTASSASIMIRKMGKGMKKSTRSLVGLFRPKSVIGVPAADGPLPLASQAQVSMVTVEAEREKVNVNANPHDQAGGGTGYPKLERNSIDAARANSTVTERLGSSSTDNSAARRSIVGGEKERAEVLAAVKKGILKRSGTDSGNNSPIIRPADTKAPNFQLPQIPHVNDSPNSSAPSTPNDEQQGHRRTGSVTLGGEDYFMSALRFRSDSKSVPGTPQGAPGKRNATFSPRIQFHDTWPSGEYDRRGEIATCNRLTPMLAQQIKEELNTFKMEMEVHENSKIYTHFF